MYEYLKYLQAIKTTRMKLSDVGSIHCKKRLAIFPSPAGILRTKLSLAGNNLIIAKYFLLQSSKSKMTYRLSHQGNNVVSDFGHSNHALDEIC
jgi:hypothetical protein